MLYYKLSAYLMLRYVHDFFTYYFNWRFLSMISLANVSTVSALNFSWEFLPYSEFLRSAIFTSDHIGFGSWYSTTFVIEFRARSYQPSWDLFSGSCRIVKSPVLSQQIYLSTLELNQHPKHLKFISTSFIYSMKEVKLLMVTRFEEEKSCGKIQR